MLKGEKMNFIPLLMTFALLINESPAGTEKAAEEPRPRESLRITKIDPPSPNVRGTAVSLALSGLDQSDNVLFVFMKEAGSPADGVRGPHSPQSGDDKAVPASITPDKKGCAFTIPVALKLGTYYIGVSRLQNDLPSDRVLLQVTRDSKVPLAVTAVEPATVFPNEEHKLYDIIVLGDGFSEVPEDNVLVLDGRDEINAAWTPEAAKAGRVRAIFHSTHKLEFQGIPAKYWGIEGVQIRVGDVYSQPPRPVTLSGYASGVPMFAAAGVVILLMLLVYLLVGRGLKPAKIADQTHNVLTTLLLDSETDSYSLSKFQLYSWTAAAIFGYVYMLLTRSLIQGKFEFADVPENLPGLLLVSGSTSVIAKGITSLRGPKGAGDIQPSLSDFITVGGVVSAERFQFFVWTVLGVLAFVFLIVAQAPAQFQELPRIPQGFLYLMGVSSAGYLGGKLARKPGPVIDSVVAQHGSLVLEIVGRCLSRDASFLIEDAPVTTRLISASVQAMSTTAPAADAELEVIRKDDSSPDPSSYAADLRLTMLDEASWLTRNGLPVNLFNPAGSGPAKMPQVPPAPVPPAGVTALAAAPSAASSGPAPKIQLTITNPDGQMAVWMFEVKPK